MYYTGIDVHCKHCDVTTINEKGEIVMRSCFETSAKALIDATKNKFSPKTVTFEETNLADWAYRTLKPHVKEIIVCDPHQNSWIAKSKQKNDKIDSYKLAKLLLGGYLKQIYHTPDNNQHKFKELVLHYHDQVKELVRLKNKLKAKFRQAGVFVTGDNVYDPESRCKWLSQLTSNSIMLFQIKQLYAEIDLFEQNQKEIRKCLMQSAKLYPHIKRFMSIPGVGLITSTTFVAIVDTPYRFANKNNLWSYCGFGLVNRESDNKKEPKRLNRTCNKTLKYVLKSAAQRASRTKKTRFSEQYKRLVSHGVSNSNAYLSIARSICTVMYGMWKSGKEYQPELNVAVID